MDYYKHLNIMDTSSSIKIKRVVVALVLGVLTVVNVAAQSYDLNQCTVSDTPKARYLYNGSRGISLPTPVVTYGNVTLVDGTHYTVTITDSIGQTVTQVVEPGDYTLTLAAISPCTGTRQFPFTVIQPWSWDDKDRIYKIYTTADLDRVATFVNSGEFDMKGFRFRLVNDLAYDPNIPNNYTPIGTAEHRFCGTIGGFNGHQHTISGIRISTDSDYQGLIGAMGDGGGVHSLILDDAQISGGSMVGGFVGDAVSEIEYGHYTPSNIFDNSRVTNSIISGSGDYVGGFAGRNGGGGDKSNWDFLHLSNTQVSGGGNNVGGIVGSNESHSILESSLSVTDSQITGNGNNVGGIAGNNEGSILFSKQYSGTFTVTNTVINGNNNVGGIVGFNNHGTIDGFNTWQDGKLDETVLVSNTSVNGNQSVGGIVGKNLEANVNDCLVDNDVSISGNSNLGAILGSNSNSTLHNNHYLYGCTVGGATGNVGTSEGDIDGAVAYLAINLHSSLSLATSSTGGFVYDGELYADAGDTLTLNQSGLDNFYIYVVDHGTITPANGGSSTYTLIIDEDAIEAVNVTIAPDPEHSDHWGIASGADGSEEHPYIIATTDDLDYLAMRVNEYGDHFPDNYFKMVNDIAYDPNNLTIDYDGDGTNESNYIPIGGNTSENNLNYYFSGHFDGCGHTISGIRLKNSQYHLGVFGIVKSNETALAEIKNLTLDNTEITGKYYVGGIVGNNTGFRVSNQIYINGGIVTNCHVTNTVAIYGETSFGGIVGRNNSGAVTHCTSAASFIFGTSDAYLVSIGGIVGTNSSYKNNTSIVSHCTSAVTFTFETGIQDIDLMKLGGIVGTNSDNGTNIVSNCFAIGISITIPTTTNEQGGIAAIVGSNGGTLDHNYYYNCSVDGASTNIGYGVYYFDDDLDDFYSYFGDLPENDGAVPGYLLNLGNHITSDALTLTVPACGESPETTYHVATSGATITLDYEYADSAIVYYVNGEAIEGNTFTMPAEDVTVKAVWTDYTIRNANDWEIFCDALQDNDTYDRFFGKTVRLDADITVERMAGSSYHDFKGTFDGQGHTLTVNYGTAENPIDEEYAAPFRNVESGASIHSLNVDGHIYTSNKFAGGIVGNQYGNDIVVNNCRSSVIIHSSKNGDGTHGGIVANQHGGSLTVSGCVYDGRMLTTNGTTLCGGLVGWRSTTCTISDCLYAPATDVTLAAGETYINDRSTLCRNYSGTPTNCYYTETLGEAQGKQARSITGGNDVTVAASGDSTVYAVSGITAYGTGLMYGGVLYAGENDVMPLTLGYTGSGVLQGFTASAGTLAGTANPYTLTMPDADVVISARVSSMLGDVNGDGSVTSADVTCVYNYLLNGDTTFIDTCDVNGDGYITSADITVIYNILLGNKKK